MQPAKTVAEARENLRRLRQARDSRQCQQVMGRLANHARAAELEPQIIEMTEIYSDCRRVTSYPIIEPLKWPELGQL